MRKSSSSSIKKEFVTLSLFSSSLLFDVSVSGVSFITSVKGSFRMISVDSVSVSTASVFSCSIEFSTTSELSSISDSDTETGSSTVADILDLSFD